MSKTYTLTFNNDDTASGYAFRLGSTTGDYIHSPYTASPGDELYLRSAKISNEINGTTYSANDLDGKILTFSSDVNIVGSGGPSISLSKGCIIIFE